MKEKNIERNYTLDGIYLKLTGLPHMPDRLWLRDGSRVDFIEFKRPGKDLRPGQEEMKKRLIAMGFNVHVIDRKKDLEALK